MKRTMTLAAVLAFAGGAHSARAQWTVTDLHPAGASSSGGVTVLRIRDGQEVGMAVFGGVQHAGVWRGTAESWMDLYPAGATWSGAYGVWGNQVVGTAGFGGFDHAWVWTGTPTPMWTDLNPPGSSQSFAWDVWDGRQVGSAIVGGVYHAGYWLSTPEFHDLHPAGVNSSYLYATSGARQVGSVYLVVDGTVRNHAGLWGLTPESWGDLNPAGSIESRAYGVFGDQAVGYFKTVVNGPLYACLWNIGGPWVDLTPAGAASSRATGVWGDMQVGAGAFGAQARAGLWHGTAASWEDLHQFVPPQFIHSVAHGVWNDGHFTYVVGIGADSAGNTHALLWTRPLSCYANCDNSTVAPALNINDFTCFINRYAAGDSRANCDRSTSAPTLNVNDFTCFINAYAAGCP